MDASPATFAVEGFKFSLGLLKEVSGALPSPASIAVAAAIGGVQKIIEVVETIQDNQEQCRLLRDRLLQILLVILATLKQTATGSQTEIPPELKSKIEHFQHTLERILKNVVKIQNVTNSKRTRDKLRAALLAKSYTSDLKKCHDQLDWEMREFAVAASLTDSIRLFKVFRQLQKVLTNQYLEKLPVAKYARFDCERPDRPASCLQGTREAIIKEILAWITDPSADAQRFFWLNGLAGIGKTTIARTIAELARSLGLLGGTFFFSRRGEAELRNPALVFPTIAHQLALFDHEFCEGITAAIEADAQAPSSSLRQQLDDLIIKPLSGLDRDPERVVVVIFDAFDECEPKGANTILQLLVSAIPSLPFFLKIFVTSRPETHIQSVLIPSNKNLSITALHNIEDSVVKSDIQVYLRTSIRVLGETKGGTIGPEWVTEREIEELAEAAGKLFIWAATALRSLEDAVLRRIQLEVLLRLARKGRSEADRDNPFIQLDQLYTEALKGVIPSTNKFQTLKLLQTLLGSIVLLRNPLPVDALERLTGMGAGHAVATLNILHSVILPPAPPDHCPRTYHPSFPDFLQDPLRCTDPELLIETEKHEIRMTMHCLQLLNTKLHKDMLGNLDPTLLNSEVEDLEKKVAGVISPDLEYACRFWPSHLTKVPYSEDKDVQALLAIFASLRLLPWLESLSWMGRMREAVDCLELANSWVAKSTASSITTSLLNDGYRLLLAHFPAITESAPRIAQSILPLAPCNSQLRATYTDYTNIKVVLGAELEWSPCLMTWESHSDWVLAVAISSDGTRIASGSDDKNIHIHDASSGGFIMALIGHSGPVWSVAFSPDGSRVASGSADCTVRLWDATTSHELMKLEGHTATVYSVVFSPNGRRIASGSGDRTIRVWHAVAGNVLMTLNEHSDDVMSVCFFLDGSRLASGSDDETVRIWDLASGASVTELKGHSDAVWSVAVSPDGSRIASGSDDKAIRIWDASNGAGLATLLGHTREVYSVAFSPNGDRIVSGSDDHSVRLWNATTGDPIATFRGHTNQVRSVVFSPDGRRVVSASWDLTVKIWDANAMAETGLQDSTSHSRRVVSLAFSSHGTRLASLGWDDVVRVSDLVEGCSTFSFSAEVVDESAYFSSDDTLITLTHPLKSPRIFDVNTGNQTVAEGTPILDIRDQSPTPFKVEDGKLLRTDVEPPTPVCILPPSYHVEITAISSFELGGAPGDRVAIGFEDGRVLVLDVAACS